MSVCTLTKFRAFLRSLVVLGVLSAERCYYWKLFFKTLFTAPRKFPLAITMAVYGYHFRKLTEKIIRETAPSKKDGTCQTENGDYASRSAGKNPTRDPIV